MSVKKKFNIWFLTIFLVFASSSLYAFSNFTTVGNKVENLIDRTVQETVIGKEIQRAIATQGMFLRAYYLEQSEFNLDRLNAYNTLLQDQVNLLQTFENEQTKDMLSTLQLATDQIIRAADNAVAAIQKNNFEFALSLINNDFSQANSEIYNLTVSILDIQNARLIATAEDTKTAVTFSTIMSIIGLVTGAIIIIALTIFVRRRIVTPLQNVSEQAAIIASGDLTQPDYIYNAKDEIGVLSHAFNEMKRNFVQILQNVHVSTNHLSASAEQLVASTEQVSQASEDVASKVAHTSELANNTTVAATESSFAMEETSSGVQRIAESAQHLLHNTVHMNEEAQSGVATIEQAQLQMTTISKSTSHISNVTQTLSKQSEEISEIITVITAITEQTNLLALNAAIEAARAGEHGKGFAVVADEVRKLAEQSKQSAEQIVSLTKQIQEGTKNVEIAVASGLTSVSDGVDIIQGAGNTFKSISTTIQTLTGQVEEISAASEQISASAEEVTASVTEIATSSKYSSESFESIASATEEQAATMNEISSVASSLNANAVELKELIAKFKL